MGYIGGLLRIYLYICHWIAEYAIYYGWHLGYCLVDETTNFIQLTNNRHAKCSRLVAWVCAFVSMVLGRTSQQKQYSRFSFFELNGCHLLAAT